MTDESAAPGHEEREEFILNHTELATPPIVPEIRLYLSTEVTPLWEATETWLNDKQLPPPFWAFCWPGGQALARYILDKPEIVRGRTILDFGAGGGIVAIAAALAGAGLATACDIDPFARTASRINGRLNGVDVTTAADTATLRDSDWDFVLLGDMCYERDASADFTDWLKRMAAKCPVLIGDPGRAYMPDDQMVKLTEYEIPTPVDLEDKPTMSTGVWQFNDGSQPALLSSV